MSTKVVVEAIIFWVDWDELGEIEVLLKEITVVEVGEAVVGIVVVAKELFDTIIGIVVVWLILLTDGVEMVVLIDIGKVVWAWHNSSF